MPTLDPALWRDIIQHLRRHHGPICRQWFEKLQPLGLNGGLLQIQATTTIHQNYLQKNCLKQFTEAAQAATGALVGVRFVTEPIKSDSNRTTGPTRHKFQVESGSKRPHQLPPTPSLGNFGADQITISPDHCLDNFVTGPNNDLAHAAAMAVAKHPGSAYNPLFLEGGVGLGKTHLLQAICQEILKQTDLVILYVSCGSFVNQFLESVENGAINEFRHRYRQVDVLAIDDIHFLGNRQRLQEEFFHTFNQLHQSNRQIILSSDSTPAEIPHLEERLVSRFQSGLVVRVTKPDYETRVAIVRAKAKLRDFDLPDSVVDYIATTRDTHARALEGAITTLQAYVNLQNKSLDLKLAQTVLGGQEGDVRSSQGMLQKIIDVVTDHYQVRLADLQSRRRHKSIAEPRQICMYLARKLTRFSLEEIGGYFGGRDHTTVMHSVRIINERLQMDSEFRREYKHLHSQTQKEPQPTALSA